MSVPGTTQDEYEVRDLEHARSIAVWLSGGRWAAENLSEAQRKAIRWLIAETEPRSHRVEITRNSDTYLTIVNALAFYALGCHDSSRMIEALEEIGADGMADSIGKAKGVR